MAEYWRDTSIVGAYAGTDAVVQMALGAHVVWDGTRPVLVTVRAASASAGIPAPVVHAGQTVGVGAATAVSEMSPPAVCTGVTIMPPPMSAAGTLTSPMVVSENLIDVPPMSATGSMWPALGFEVQGVSIIVPWQSGTAAFMPPAVTAAVIIGVPRMDAFGDMESPSYGSHYTGAMVPMTATGSVWPAVVHAGQTLTPDKVPGNTFGGVMFGGGWIELTSSTPNGNPVFHPAPTVHAGVTIGVPTMTATGSMWPAEFTVFSPISILKDGNQTLASQSVWETIHPWTSETGYKTAPFNGDGVDVPSGTYRIVAQLQGSNISSYRAGMRILCDQNAIETLDVSGGAPYRNVEGVYTLPGGVVTMEGLSGRGSYSDRGVIAAGTWMRIMDAAKVQSIHLASTFTTSGLGDWNTLTGWAADTGDYPNTDLSGDGLTVTPGTYRLVAQAEISGIGSYSAGLRLRLDGDTLVEVDYAGGGPYRTISEIVTITTDGTLTAQVEVGRSSASDRQVYADTTWIIIEPV
ncbi:hypothetical protein [Tomitella gaofuii]|uniref:hypothetical protein n=1 Tax=Tomitella gaofuii TaxID=2760083 RepID=UPI0015F7F2CB|nr:hypothetical protein [Tomitella gaofuii]